jgi:type VI secretion system protein VasG
MADIELKTLLGRLNRTSTKALEAAAGWCVSRGNYEISVEHLLHELVQHGGSDVALIVAHYEVDAAKLKRGLLEVLEDQRTGNPGRPVFSPLLVEWFQQAWLLGSLDHDLAEIRSGALLRALLGNLARFGNGDYLELLEKIPRDELKKDLLQIGARGEEAATANARAETPSAKSGEGGATAPRSDGMLGKYTIDFTAQARAGRIDPVFGRDNEIRQFIDVLARRRKNNPIVVGEAGVGKTAVIEGLAMRVVEGDVPDILKNVRIVGLDIGLLQAGASVKGEFETRLKGVIEEIKSSPTPIILFIDEAHTLIGAGGQAGTGDAANLLKPALARGELRTIAATTWSEYKKYIEKDPALARRFQLVKIEEPSVEVTAGMLRGLKSRFESAHGVIIRDDAVVTAAELGSRYISGRQHPDKGVDLIDTAAARVKIALATKPGALEIIERTIQAFERELSALERDRGQGVAGLDERITAIGTSLVERRAAQAELSARWLTEKAAAEAVLAIRAKLFPPEPAKAPLAPTPAAAKPGAAAKPVPAPAAAPAKLSAADEAKLRQDLVAAGAALSALQGKDPLVPIEVTPDVIARVVSDWTGIPIGKMVSDQAAALLDMERVLGERIKGQDHALATIATRVRAAKAGLKPPEQPMGIFLLVGPSGVGKTETALGIADLMFGGERFMTTINMSEFMEKHSVSKLIGSPPGYVGYGEGGMLTEAVRQRPYSVVLLDECEKADPEVLNLFYQVFDKGILNDGEGRGVDFKDTVMFLTSNLATDLITEATRDGKRPDMDKLVEHIRPALSRHFKPALLARMTIVPYFAIPAEAMRGITELKLGRLRKRLMETHKLALEVSPAVIDGIVARCTEVETGARNVDHIISGTLLPRISSEILGLMSSGGRADSLKIDVDGKGGFAFSFTSAGSSAAASAPAGSGQAG